MPSVIATWSGTYHHEELQKELTSYLQVLAQRNEFRTLNSRPYQAALKEIRQQEGVEDQFIIPDIRVYDNELSGEILIDSNTVKQMKREAFLHEASRAGIAIEELIKDPPDAEIDQLLRDLFNQSDKDSDEEQCTCGSVLLLNKLKIRGIDFRLFDPRDLYPHENRLSFVFLESKEAPFLNGRVVEVNDHNQCKLYRYKLICDADWYVCSPSVHLRYYLEQWFDKLFAWIKFFYMPDLRYWRWDDLSGYEKYRIILDDLRAKVEESEAKRVFFEEILRDFEEEVDKWEKIMKDNDIGKP